MYLKPLKIGNVTLENNILLAPMAGITDLPFRMICKNYGAGLVTTEMVSSKAIFHQDQKTMKLLTMEGEKRPVCVQIFGSDIESMKVATEKVSMLADVIDINMGCPAPKVTKNGDGSRLLLDLDLAYDIAKTVVEHSCVPVTAKIRLGWDKDHIVAVETAKRLEEAGVSAITVHGRTRSQFYTETADLDRIKEVKEAVKIPVIGNGDVVDEDSAKYMFAYTGVDGIMIGRGALGNPWIFNKIIHNLQTGNKLEEPEKEEKLKVILQHMDLAVKEKGEYTAIREMRKHIAWYIKNMKNASMMRQQINTLETRKEVEACLKEYFMSI